MSRPLRIGAFYHITARGNEKGSIFPIPQVSHVKILTPNCFQLVQMANRNSKPRLKDILVGNGSVRIAGVYLSWRMVKEALERKYRLIVIEESVNHLRCKIIRSRVIGPWIFFPDPTIDISMDKSNNVTTLSWEFKWPEYYWPIIGSIIALAAGLFWLRNFSLGIIAFIWTFVFLGCVTFCESQITAWRVRKALGGLIGVRS